MHVPMPAPVKTEYAGIAMPAGTFDEDDDEFTSPDLDGYSLQVEGEGTGKVEDFFDIEEASDDKPSAEIQIEPQTADS